MRDHGIVVRTDSPTDDFGWPLTEGQLRRRLLELGAEARWVSQSHIRCTASENHDGDGVLATAVILAYWWPKGSWLSRSEDGTEVFINLVPRDVLGTVRSQLVEKVVPDLAAWFKEAQDEGEGWKALRHGCAWLWERPNLLPFDFVPKPHRLAP